MVVLMRGHNGKEWLGQSDGRTMRAAAGSLTHLADLGTMKLQHQRSVTNADYYLAQLRICKRLTQRASKAQPGPYVALFGSHPPVPYSFLY